MALIPSLFVSHSHFDKRSVRAIVRRLTAHGVRAWLDEHELEVGSSLTSAIRDQIRRADSMLVIASRAAAESEWVELEVSFARQNQKPIIPVFIEPVFEHASFRDQLGIDATAPQAFASAIDSLIRDVYKRAHREVPPADPGVLLAGLSELAQEEPNLAPLIDACLDGRGLHSENLPGAFAAHFHSLDHAVNALCDARPGERSALHAAYAFSHAGAGTRALLSWIGLSGDGGLPIVVAVGDHLDPALLSTAIELLRACNPPNNHALYKFIGHNAQRLDAAQRLAVIRLVTWPIRNDTTRLGDVLGWVAAKHLPEAPEVFQMWARWIRSGAFDGRSSSEKDLARYLADADKAQMRGWDSVNQALRDHVRGQFNSGEKEKVLCATSHVQAAADAASPVLASLLIEAERAPWCAEWNDWASREPDTVEWMRAYLSEVCREAGRDRNWLRAREEADRTVVLSKNRRLLLDKDRTLRERG